MLADARRRRLTERLLERGSITVRESAAEFGVTTETIRKDILHLEGEGVAHKRFGGAVISTAFSEPRVPVPAPLPTDAMAAIAAHALTLIPAGASVFIDGGRTARHLGERLALRSGFTIFTNSIPLLGALSSSDNDVFVVGGRLQPHAMSNVGTWAVQAMRATRIDLAFLGSDGFGDTGGPTSASYDESEFKSTVVNSAGSAIVLADSTKTGHAGLFTFSPWSAIAALITNGGLPPVDLVDLRAATDVHIV